MIPLGLALLVGLLIGFLVSRVWFVPELATVGSIPAAPNLPESQSPQSEADPSDCPPTDEESGEKQSPCDCPPEHQELSGKETSDPPFPWGPDELRWAVRPPTSRYGDFWFLGLDGEMAVCEGSDRCITVPEELVGVCDGFGCVRTDYEFKEFLGSEARFRTGQSIPTAWTPFPKTLVFDMEAGQWADSNDPALPLTEVVDFGWMVLSSRSEVDAHLSSVTVTDGVVVIKIRNPGAIQAGGRFMPPWIRSSYSVTDDALQLVLHGTSVLQPLPDVKGLTDKFIEDISVTADDDAHLCKLLISLHDATAFWVTVEGLKEESAVVEVHFR